MGSTAQLNTDIAGMPGFAYAFDFTTVSGTPDGGTYAQATYNTKSIAGGSTIAAIAGSGANDHLNVEAGDKAWLCTDAVGQYLCARSSTGTSAWPGSAPALNIANANLSKSYDAGNPGTWLDPLNCWMLVVFDYAVRGGDFYAAWNDTASLVTLDGRFQIDITADGLIQVSDLNTDQTVNNTQNPKDVGAPIYAHAGTNVLVIRSNGAGNTFTFDSYHFGTVVAGAISPANTGTMVLVRLGRNSRASNPSAAWCYPKWRYFAAGTGSLPADSDVATIMADCASAFGLRAFTRSCAWLGDSLSSGYRDLPGETQAGRRATRNPTECWLNCSHAGASVTRAYTLQINSAVNYVIRVGADTSGAPHTSTIAYNASAATIQAALRAVGVIGSSGATVTGTYPTFNIVVQTATLTGVLYLHNVATSGSVLTTNTISEIQVARALTFRSDIQTYFGITDSRAHACGGTNDTGQAQSDVNAALDATYTALKAAFTHVSAATPPPEAQSGASDGAVAGYESALRLTAAHVQAASGLYAIADIKGAIPTGTGTAAEVRTAMQTYLTNGFWSPDGTTLLVSAATAGVPNSMDGVHGGLVAQSAWFAMHNTAINGHNSGGPPVTTHAAPIRSRDRTRSR